MPVTLPSTSVALITTSPLASYDPIYGTEAPKLYVVPGVSTTRAQRDWDHPSVGPKSEGETLAMLSPRARWAAISVAHPLEFWVSIAAITAAAYVLVKGTFLAVPAIGNVLITTANAQSVSPRAFASGFNLEWFVAIVVAIALLWSYGIISWATTAKKIDTAKESTKLLSGFLFGLVTGSKT